MYTKALPYLTALVGMIQLTLASDVGRSDCIADETINAEFGSPTVPEGSCCQAEICGLGCPEEVDPPEQGKLVDSLYLSIG